MKTLVTVVALCLLSVCVLTQASPRNRRQTARTEFKAHFFPFAEMCARNMGLPRSEILATAVESITGAFNCSSFYLHCVDVYFGVKTYLEECGVGMWWSEKAGTCEIPTLADRPECSRELCRVLWTGNGVVPDPRSCYGFYECSMGQAFFEMCENNSAFNSTTLSCENSPTCDRPAPRILPFGRLCTEADMPRVCTPPGYIPSLSYCACVHQHLERK